MRGLIATVAMGLSQFQDDRGADLHLCGLGTRLGGLRGSKVLRAAPGISRSMKIKKKYAPVELVWDTLEAGGDTLGVQTRPPPGPCRLSLALKYGTLFAGPEVAFSPPTM